MDQHDIPIERVKSLLLSGDMSLKLKTSLSGVDQC
jgi:hypothetical protein